MTFWNFQVGETENLQHEYLDFVRDSDNSDNSDIAFSDIDNLDSVSVISEETKEETESRMAALEATKVQCPVSWPNIGELFTVFVRTNLGQLVSKCCHFYACVTFARITFRMRIVIHPTSILHRLFFIVVYARESKNMVHGNPASERGSEPNTKRRGPSLFSDWPFWWQHCRESGSLQIA